MMQSSRFLSLLPERDGSLARTSSPQHEAPLAKHPSRRGRRKHPENAALYRSLPATLGADPNDLEAWHALTPTATERQRGELLARLGRIKTESR